jgi:hypothetical protein
MSSDSETNPNDWLTRLTSIELAWWEAKPQPDKEWWYANTKPEDRGEILRNEILAMARHNEFLHLPEATRSAILNQNEKNAEEARIRIRQFISKKDDQDKQK